ncbi:hypothetical protein PQX77_012539 [Marasmius sp. AFHP31]|nr:hypothetical protein PQX77_012539 [Marasmius sp. AFHP31]
MDEESRTQAQVASELEGRNKRKRSEASEDAEIPLKRTKGETHLSGELGLTGRIPNEILSEIFLLCPRLNHSFVAEANPWSFTRVCRRWRRISINLPQIWTTIVIGVADITKTARRSNHTLEMLKLILTRTAEKNLHVVISVTQVPPKRIRVFFDLLRSTCHRWASLSLLGRVRKADWTGDKYAGIAMYPEKNHHPQGFASLERVTIESMATFEHRRKLLTAFERAPKLRFISLQGFAGTQKRGDPPPGLNWGLLSHFEIECFPE